MRNTKEVILAIAFAAAIITTTAANAMPQASAETKEASIPVAPTALHAVLPQGNCIAGYNMDLNGTPHPILTAPYKSYPICGTAAAPWPVAGCFVTPVQINFYGETISMNYQFCTHSSRG